MLPAVDYFWVNISLPAIGGMSGFAGQARANAQIFEPKAQVFSQMR
jgi:hypothetical protein